jgi:phosphonate transport system substrate-binding protein
MNWWNTPERPEPDPDGHQQGHGEAGGFRIVWKSELLPGSPYAYLNTLPADLRKKISDAFLNMHVEAKPLLDKMEDGKTARFVPVSHKDYLDMGEMLKFIDELRRKRS